MSTDVEALSSSSSKRKTKPASKQAPQSQSNNNSASVPTNPYQQQVPPGALPPDHVVHKLKRVLYMTLSAVGLHYFKFFKALVKSPNVRHSWFQLGLAITVAILMIKTYVETYDVKIRNRAVNYETYPQTTHTVIGLILAATIAFNVALWPHYGWNAPILLGLCFFGVILQFVLLVPTHVQNIVGLAVFMFVVQEYSGTSNWMV